MSTLESKGSQRLANPEFNQLALYFTGKVIYAQFYRRIVAFLNPAEQSLMSRLNLKNVEIFPKADTSLVALNNPHIPSLEQLARDSRRSPRRMAGFARDLYLDIVDLQGEHEAVISMPRSEWNKFLARNVVGKTRFPRFIRPRVGKPIETEQQGTVPSEATSEPIPFKPAA